VYDKKNNIYNLKTKNLIIKGDNIEDVKNKLDEGYNNLIKEQENVNKEKNKIQENFNNLIEQEKKLKSDIYANRFYSNIKILLLSYIKHCSYNYIYIH
jgi:hypothetical protein